MRPLCLLLLFTSQTLYATVATLKLDEQHPIVNIDKLSWQFYWQKLLTPAEIKGVKPDLTLKKVSAWHRLTVNGQNLPSYGYATYRTRFKLKAGTYVGLKIPGTFTSHIAWVNGKKLAQAGRPATTPEDVRHRRRTTMVYFEAQAVNELVVQVSNYIHSKAGLRGPIKLGLADALKQADLRASAIDVFAIGIIFAIAVYHIFLFFLRRQQKAYLVFAIMAIVYFFQGFLFGRQAVSLFIPDLPMNVHFRVAHFFTYSIAPLIITFTFLLYQGIIHRYVLYAFWGVNAVYVCLLFFDVQIFTSLAVYNYVLSGVSAVAVSVFAIGRAALQRRGGALALLTGIGVFLGLVCYAIYLSLSDEIAGSFVSIGFAGFALSQSIALSREHAALEKKNTQMQDGLEQSRQALAQQRSQIEANLHDSLGGNLTDLKLATEALARRRTSPATKKELQKLVKRIDGSIGSLRTQLLFLEDLELVTEDFFAGIQLILLRRYTDAGYELNFTVKESARVLLESEEVSHRFFADKKLELTLVLQEICTNTLKYGKKEARWLFNAEAGQLVIQVVNSMENTKPKNSGELGTKTVAQRLRNLNATITTDSMGKEYVVEIKVPL